MAAPTKRSRPKPASTAAEPAKTEPPASGGTEWDTATPHDGDFKKARRDKAQLTDPTKTDRLPPHSTEAEQGVLGCILLSPGTCISQCIMKLTAGPEVFYDLRHRAIYEVLVEMDDQRAAIDLITVHQRLKDRNQLDAVGGLSYLASLPDAVPSAANLDYYIEIVREKHVRRRMVVTGTDVVRRAFEQENDLDSLLDEVEHDLQKTVEDAAVAKPEAFHVKTLISPALHHIEELLKGGKVSISTGFPDLDELTWGLQPSEMAVLAARPSVGKTALAMNIAEHLSMNGISVGVFSLEMSKESLLQRLLCARARINFQDIRKGTLSQEDQKKLLTAAGEMTKAQLYIDDTAGLSIRELRARARRMHQQLGCRVFIIDYLQLMHAQTRRMDNRQNEVTLISGGVKGLAKELKVPVLVLSQLSRKMEDRGHSAKPKLSDLRESGSIEQDADMVVLLHKKPEKDGEHTPTILVHATVAKNRNGPTGETELTFLKFCTRFESAAKIHEEDIPDEQNLLI